MNNLEEFLIEMDYLMPFDCEVRMEIVNVHGFGVNVRLHAPRGNTPPQNYLIRDDRAILIDYDKELSEHDAAFVMIRVSGDVVCGHCDKIYYKHPPETRILDQEDRPYLIRMCCGMLGKL